MRAAIVVALCCMSAIHAFFAPATPKARFDCAVRAQAESIFSKEFENTDGISVDESGPLRKVTLRTAGGDEAEIYTSGACVASFTTDNYDVLFVRPDAKLDGSKPVSGGLPLCFPQFGPGEIQQHGFARNLEWETDSSRAGASPSITLKLQEGPETLKMWDHKFTALYTVTLSSGVLSTTWKVKNTDDKPFSFQSALHSYFRVGDIEKATVRAGGFLFADYLDKTANPPETKQWTAGEVTIDKAVDSVYYGVTGEVVLEDAAACKKLRIKSSGYADTIIWSPWGDDNMGYKQFVCIECGKVKEPVTLQAGEEWVGKMDLFPSAL